MKKVYLIPLIGLFVVVYDFEKKPSRITPGMFKALTIQLIYMGIACVTFLFLLLYNLYLLFNAY